MTALRLLTPEADRVPAYSRPPRMPDELLAADLPDWCKAVWLAVRAVQGANDEAWADYSTYGERCRKSVDMVRKAVGELRRGGWVETVGRNGNTPVLRCHVPGVTGNPVPHRAPSGEEQGSQNERPGMSGREQGSQVGRNPVPSGEEQGSHPPTPPNKDESVKESVQESAQGGGPPRALGFPDWLEGLIARAPHRSAVRGSAYATPDAPAVAVYVAGTGKRPPPMSGHEALIRSTVGGAPQAVRRWAEVVATWAATHEPGHVGRPYNLANVRKMLGNYAESVEADPLPVSDPVAAPTARAEDLRRQQLAGLGLTEAEIEDELAYLRS